MRKIWMIDQQSRRKIPTHRKILSWLRAISFIQAVEWVKHLCFRANHDFEGHSGFSFSHSTWSPGHWAWVCLALDLHGLAALARSALVTWRRPQHFMLPQPQRSLGNQATLSSFPHPCKVSENSHFSTQRHLTCGRRPCNRDGFHCHYL